MGRYVEIGYDEAQTRWQERRPVGVIRETPYAGLEPWWLTRGEAWGTDDIAEIDDAYWASKLTPLEVPSKSPRFARPAREALGRDGFGHVAEGRVFSLSSMSAEFVRPFETVGDTGSLPDEWRDMLDGAHAALEHGEALYVVRSFSTPIGWRRIDAGGTPHPGYVAPVDYSMTTRQHQMMTLGAWKLEQPAVWHRSAEKERNPRSPFGTSRMIENMSTR